MCERRRRTGRKLMQNCYTKRVQANMSTRESIQEIYSPCNEGQVVFGQLPNINQDDLPHRPRCSAVVYQMHKDLRTFITEKSYLSIQTKILSLLVYSKLGEDRKHRVLIFLLDFFPTNLQPSLLLSHPCIFHEFT